MTFSDRSLRALWWATCGFILAAFVIGLTLHTLSTSGADQGSSWGSGGFWTGFLFTLITFMFPVAGAVIARREPRNPVGWVLLLIGVGWSLDALFTGFAGYYWLSHQRFVTASHVAVQLDQWTWIPAIGLTGTFLLLLFPDGHLPSRRWRPVAWVAGVAIALSIVGQSFAPGTAKQTGFPEFRNPIGLPFLAWLVPLLYVAIALIPLGIIASAAALVVRFRRSRGLERLQMKWLATSAATVALLYLVAMAATLPFDNFGNRPAPTWTPFLQDLALFSFVLIPIAVGIAVLKHRLYDIDVVINRALVYGALAAFITAVYVAIVVGIGTAIGNRGSLGLSILATALVAIGFQPVRQRVQRVANRLVYGERATPYEVLAQLSGQAAHAVATEDLLPQMARVAASATGASRVDVWLRVGDQLVPEASWPVGGPGLAAIPIDGGSDPSIGDVDLAVPVRHQGEVLGAIAVTKDVRESVTPADRKLLEDLASQAGLVLRNVRLIEELRSSRQRLVRAQDDERRRLERDLHDGAQQRIVATALAVRMARTQVRPDADPAVGQRIDQASEQLQLALTELRELARGIHPAILTERGLGPALSSLAERSPVPATVEVALGERLPAQIEATAYFVVSEALANVGKYAGASSVRIGAALEDHRLVISVADDGTGGADPSKGSGLQGLLDRVAAVDGTLEVDSPPGEGTTLTARLPVPAGAAERLHPDPSPAMATVPA
jgi:signal transduction histidine kinase